jgi:hypothetical protein
MSTHVSSYASQRMLDHTPHSNGRCHLHGGCWTDRVHSWNSSFTPAIRGATIGAEVNVDSVAMRGLRRAVVWHEAYDKRLKLHRAATGFRVVIAAAAAFVFGISLFYDRNLEGGFVLRFRTGKPLKSPQLNLWEALTLN